jgi:hypothetical protein
MLFIVRWRIQRETAPGGITGLGCSSTPPNGKDAGSPFTLPGKVPTPATDPPVEGAAPEKPNRPAKGFEDRKMAAPPNPSVALPPDGEAVAPAVPAGAGPGLDGAGAGNGGAAQRFRARVVFAGRLLAGNFDIWLQYGHSLRWLE